MAAPLSLMGPCFLDDPDEDYCCFSKKTIIILQKYDRPSGGRPAMCRRVKAWRGGHRCICSRRVRQAGWAAVEASRPWLSRGNRATPVDETDPEHCPSTTPELIRPAGAPQRSISADIAWSRIYPQIKPLGVIKSDWLCLCVCERDPDALTKSWLLLRNESRSCAPQ